VTGPHAYHEGADTTILSARSNVYEEAKAKHPNRWRGRAVRNWTPIGTVLLNPDRESPVAAEPERLAA
jgi:putative transposase